MSLKDHIEDPLVLAFAKAAEAHRDWLEGSLAQAEYEEGLYVDEDEVEALVDQDEARLAADTGPRLLPAEYAGGGFVVRMGLTALGATYVELVSGPGGLQVFGLDLEPGQRAEVEVDPPAELVGIDADDQPILLR